MEYPSKRIHSNIGVQSNFQIKFEILSETNKRTFIYSQYKIQIYQSRYANKENGELEIASSIKKIPILM